MNSNFSLNQMVKQQVRTWDVLDPRVLSVMTDVPRSRFVPLEWHTLAYADYNIPLDRERSMLTPKVEGRVLQALNLQASDIALECGTGSGYLSACMAALAARVTSQDTNLEFIDKAAQIAADLGLNNLHFNHCTDYKSGSDRRYDAIMINGSIPVYDDYYQKLLNPGGRLVVVVGESPVMEALLVTRINEDQFTRESLFETDIPGLTNASAPEQFEF